MNFTILTTFPLSDFGHFFRTPYFDGFQVCIAMETRILQMYGSDAGQPARSLYTKAFVICEPSCK